MSNCFIFSVNNRKLVFEPKLKLRRWKLGVEGQVWIINFEYIRVGKTWKILYDSRAALKTHLKFMVRTFKVSLASKPAGFPPSHA